MTASSDATAKVQNVTAFIDYRTAIGMLVVAGYQVQFKDSAIVLCKTGDRIGHCYRDGSAYKVKHELVLDFIDDNECLRSY